MSKDAMLPCIVCGTTLRNVFEDGDVNQPSEGTEFRTYGHYGSTFWDSFEGEEIVINICDACLRTWSERVARHKRFRKLVVTDTRGPITASTAVGRQWVDREMVPYFDGPEDNDPISIEVHEIGILQAEGHGHFERIEWVSNWRKIKRNLARQQRIDEDGPERCLHAQHLAECVLCGAQPLEGLR
jgi:hypothetical protein